MDYLKVRELYHAALNNADNLTGTVYNSREELKDAVCKKYCGAMSTVTVLNSTSSGSVRIKNGFLSRKPSVTVKFERRHRQFYITSVEEE